MWRETTKCFQSPFDALENQITESLSNFDRKFIFRHSRAMFLHLHDIQFTEELYIKIYLAPGGMQPAVTRLSLALSTSWRIMFWKKSTAVEKKVSNYSRPIAPDNNTGMKRLDGWYHPPSPLSFFLPNLMVRKATSWWFYVVVEHRKEDVIKMNIQCYCSWAADDFHSIRFSCKFSKVFRGFNFPALFLFTGDFITFGKLIALSGWIFCDFIVVKFFCWWIEIKLRNFFLLITRSKIVSCSWR